MGYVWDLAVQSDLAVQFGISLDGRPAQKCNRSHQSSNDNKKNENWAASDGVKTGHIRNLELFHSKRSMYNDNWSNLFVDREWKCVIEGL